MANIPDLFAAWLRASGMLPLQREGFASLALPTDHARVIALNAEVRSIRTPWTLDCDSWPDERWIIGEDGAGNYFTASADRDESVSFYDHESRCFESFMPSLRAYFDYCAQVEQKSRSAP